jgi:hypothetical protein
VYRFYEPNSATWSSEDPSGIKGGLNLYRYSDNNPIRLNDPLGLWPWDPLLCFFNMKRCIESALICKRRLEQRMDDVCIRRNLSGPSAAVFQICYVENPDCAKYLRYCVKTAVTPIGGSRR